MRNITSIRELNANSIDNLVALRGIVMRCSDIIPEMQRASFRCVQCGHSEEILLDRGRLEEPNICDRCYTKFSFTLEHNQSFFNNKQHIKL